VLTARQSAADRAGSGPLHAFLSGYRLGLLVAAALVLAGAVTAYLALRQARSNPAEISYPECAAEPVLSPVAL
jgi:hypothetical protein